MKAEDSGRRIPAWIHADDGFDRSKQPFEAHYFHLTEKANVVVPTGKLKIDVVKGFEYKPVAETVEAQRGDLKRVEIKLVAAGQLSTRHEALD